MDCSVINKDHPHQHKLKTYSNNQSPFYKLKCKAKLASLLQIELSILKKIIKNNDKNYYVYPKKVGNKIRTIEEPKAQLRILHERIRKLLARITPPPYLNSTVKKRGYKLNAEHHLGNYPVIKMDIEKFYPLTKFEYVYNFFHKQMACEKDIASLLAILTTFQLHLPTGSPLSDILAFYSHKPMFDRIYTLALQHNIKMSSYVDDITLSGVGLNGKIKFEVTKIIHNWGLSYHKVKHYKSHEPKLITGVIVKGKNIKLPNKRHLKLHTLRQEINNGAEDTKLITSYIGGVREAESIDLSIAKKNYLEKIKRYVPT